MLPYMIPLIALLVFGVVLMALAWRKMRKPDEWVVCMMGDDGNWEKLHTVKSFEEGVLWVSNKRLADGHNFVLYSVFRVA